MRVPRLGEFNLPRPTDNDACPAFVLFHLGAAPVRLAVDRFVLGERVAAMNEFRIAALSGHKAKLVGQPTEIDVLELVQLFVVRGRIVRVDVVDGISCEQSIRNTID